MYGRRIGDATLTFEASGALQNASLVMRDRETDSWWSIMSSDAIGGPLKGADLPELAVSEKVTWGEWKARYPDTRVLSVDGREHDDTNPYDRYLTSDDTFRGLEVDDDRLPPKEPIWAFHLDGNPFAVPHAAAEGGALFRLDDDRRVYVHRDPGASFFASSRAWLLPAEAPFSTGAPPDLHARLQAGEVPGAEPIPGFDTYWYTWVGVNGNTRLLTD